ncbi:MAG: cell division protein FtsB [Gammaproteobacteria bacterium]|nr:cell division protein FtsB [Gammaproteobacteria bacterium]
MKWLFVILIILFIVLQQKIWVADGGMSDVFRIGSEVEQQKNTNTKLKERNQALEAEVRDLKQGLEAVEERARSELGMVKENEIFYQVVEEQ